MRRRQFIELTVGALAAGAAGACASRGGRSPVATGAGVSPPLDAAAFHATRRFAEIAAGRIAYLERGSGPAALFLHGVPLSGFQWRGAIDRLSSHRRCVAPDFMGMGYSEVPEHQALAAADQAAMLIALLDELGIDRVDIVASDSGGAAAQLLMVRNPERVRTLLLTNCDAEPDSPPPAVKPVIAMARAGTLADMIAGWLADRPRARAEFGKAVYRDPTQLTDEAIEYHWSPVVASPRRRAQFHAYHVAFEPNPLAGIEAALRRSTVPTRIVWGTSDDVFSPESPAYLDRTLGASRGIRRVPGGKLFFPEELPDVIAEEARRLWGVAG